MNKNFTIFGNPVSHSKSPQMQNAGFKSIGFNGLYTKSFLQNGKNIKKIFLENFDGANITVPHKEDAFKYAHNIVGIANKIGAVNTYIKQNNKIIAYNTDAPGFLKAIEDFKNINNVLILGAGGTAKAIAIALTNQQTKTTILNRSNNNKNFFTNNGCRFFTWDTFNITQKYDLIINSTSAGLKDNSYPAPLHILQLLFKDTSFAFDCIYGKTTPFLKLAQKHNIQSKDGEDMLLYQGVLAFELFTNTKADKNTIEIMREALRK